jgi:5-methylcytosine-specific restriction endonuclease McrA
MKENTNEISASKICNKCNVEKHLDSFHLNPKLRDGHKGTCKECKNKAGRKSYTDNREKRLVSAKKSREKYKEKYAVKKKEYEKANREKIKMRQRLFYRENTEAKAKKQARRDAWLVEHPEKRKEYSERRRFKMTLGSNPEVLEYSRILMRDPCWYCGGITTTVDHIVSISKGGTNDCTNLAACCDNCSSSKGEKSLLVWMIEQKEEYDLQQGVPTRNLANFVN